MVLVVSGFSAIKEAFRLDWEIEYQGINVADQAAAAGGDVTVKQGGNVLLAAEITERVVDRERVISTFDTKISPNAIEDYLFFIRDREQAAEAIEQAKRYFTQGHEVNFVEITDWIVTMLSLVGSAGRSTFISTMVAFLDDIDLPRALKVGWNDVITDIIAAEA